VVVAATLALAVVPALIAHQSRAGHYVAAPAVCGTARWPVKTLADAAAASIDTAVAPDQRDDDAGRDPDSPPPPLA
jgi:hypothetical protein